MAAIDKTYVSTWEEYNEYVKWAKDRVFVCPNGTKIRPIDYVYDYGYEHFDGEIERVLHNTPTSLDYFLIKECPIGYSFFLNKNEIGNEKDFSSTFFCNGLCIFYCLL